jgi:hypothetical protein
MLNVLRKLQIWILDKKVFIYLCRCRQITRMWLGQARASFRHYSGLRYLDSVNTYIYRKGSAITCSIDSWLFLYSFDSWLTAYALGRIQVSIYVGQWYPRKACKDPPPLGHKPHHALSISNHQVTHIKLSLLMRQHALAMACRLYRCCSTRVTGRSPPTSDHSWVLT